jgi:hypothetical protein
MHDIARDEVDIVVAQFDVRIADTFATQLIQPCIVNP